MVAKLGKIHLLTHLPLGYLNWNFRYEIFKLILVIDGCVILCEMALVIGTRPDSGNGFLAWRHQAITWANVDPDLCDSMSPWVSDAYLAEFIWGNIKKFYLHFL